MELHQKGIQISVILPVYNGSKYLRECLDSIMSQSYYPLEIIVVNDGSTDESGEIITEYDDVISLESTNLGVAEARNIGIENSTSDWLCFIDQDDIWTKDSVKERVYQVQKPNSSMIIGRQQWFLDGIDQIPSWVKPEQMNDELDGYLLGCALIKKSLFDQYDKFDPSFRFCSDFDWFFRLKDDHVVFHQIDNLVLKKRIHSQNESRHAEQSLKELSRAIFNSIKRKRQKK